jgi:hypothetical protein
VLLPITTEGVGFEQPLDFIAEYLHTCTSSTMASSSSVGQVCHCQLLLLLSAFVDPHVLLRQLQATGNISYT